MNLSDAGLEPFSVDRPVDHERHNHSFVAQARDQGGGLAVSIRKAHAQPLANCASSVDAGYLGGDSCLVSKDELSWIEVQVFIKPALVLLQDVGMALLHCVAGLFASLSVPDEEPMRSRFADHDVLTAKRITRFEQGTIAVLGKPAP